MNRKIFEDIIIETSWLWWKSEPIHTISLMISREYKVKEIQIKLFYSQNGKRQKWEEKFEISEREGTYHVQ